MAVIKPSDNKSKHVCNSNASRRASHPVFKNHKLLSLSLKMKHQQHLDERKQEEASATNNTEAQEIEQPEPSPITVEVNDREREVFSRSGSQTSSPVPPETPMMEDVDDIVYDANRSLHALEEEAFNQGLLMDTDDLMEVTDGESFCSDVYDAESVHSDDASL